MFSQETGNNGCKKQSTPEIVDRDKAIKVSYYEEESEKKKAVCGWSTILLSLQAPTHTAFGVDKHFFLLYPFPFR